MSLEIQVLSGHRYGESFILERNTGVGRWSDISFDDPNMSKIHIYFELEHSGWVVRDNESKNGITVNGQPTALHHLVVGDLIEVGTTQFRVTAISVNWKPSLNQLLIECLDKTRNAELTLYPFRSIPVLNFIQGMQAGQKNVLEYGPRFVGGEVEDIQIFEPYCPDLAFELRRNPKGVLFLTDYPKIVQLNKEEVDKKVLKKGDQIYIHNTIIEVDFLTI